jgi:tryptophan-rich sensory protein
MTDSVAPRPWLRLIGFVSAAFAAGAIGSWATFKSVTTWYPGLRKPAWNPPAWLFGPAWTVLYIAMGVAAWRIWRTRSPSARPLLAGYFGQLAFNAGWSVLFFGLRQPGWALADIFFLWILLAWLQVRFAQLDRPAAWCWLPYLAWVSFATALNAAIVELN